MTDKVELPSFLFEHNPWEKQVNAIWPASSYILHRNLAKYLFPSKLASQEAHQALQLMKNALLALKELKEPLFLKAGEITTLDKEFLFEHFLCLTSFQNITDGQAFLIDRSDQLLVLLNIEDHLQLQLIDSNADWQKSWSFLSQVETALSTALELAYSPQFGYLTANLDHVGTGFVAHLYLHLPALIHRKQLKEQLKQLPPEILFSGMEGTVEDLVGDLLILSNRYTLGVTEETIFQSLHTQAMKLISAEKTLRETLKQNAEIEIKDDVSRAYGLALHSQQLQTKEALSALSLIKLGLSLDWISGVTDAKINEIIFKCRRAHLAHLYREKSFDLHDLPAKRAAFIHEELKGIEIKV
jgi:protein arginine kinase